jgi:tripartite-type tricarboxylate transporter receptor subunit TctC
MLLPAPMSASVVLTPEVAAFADAPAATPPLPAPVVEKLNAESVRLLALPDVKERVARLGGVPVGNSAVEARKFIHAELAKWTKTVKAAGITSGN